MKIIPRRRRPAAGRGAPRAEPEHKLQVAIRDYLVICLHPSVEWTANAAGVRVHQATAGKMKAAGVRRGWPDLQFLFPDGVTRYIELKAPLATANRSPDEGLSDEQKDFRALAEPHRIWALCRSVEEVSATLRGWGARLRDRHDATSFTDIAA